MHEDNSRIEINNYETKDIQLIEENEEEMTGSKHDPIHSYNLTLKLPEFPIYISKQITNTRHPEEHKQIYFCNKTVSPITPTTVSSDATYE